MRRGCGMRRRRIRVWRRAVFHRRGRTRLGLADFGLTHLGLPHLGLTRLGVRLNSGTRSSLIMGLDFGARSSLIMGLDLWPRLDFGPRLDLCPRLSFGSRSLVVGLDFWPRLRSLSLLEFGASRGLVIRMHDVQGTGVPSGNHTAARERCRFRGRSDGRPPLILPDPQRRVGAGHLNVLPLDRGRLDMPLVRGGHLLR